MQREGSVSGGPRTSDGESLEGPAVPCGGVARPEPHWRTKSWRRWRQQDQKQDVMVSIQTLHAVNELWSMCSR